MNTAAGGASGRGIIDVHCHILPEVDDGAKNIEEALEMLRMAESEGISGIIATPHYRGRFAPTPETVLEKIWLTLNAAAAEGIGIKLYPGGEIYCGEDFAEDFKAKKFCTLNGSRYVLVEFSPAVMYETVKNGLDGVLNAGLVPVLAHAERYACLLGGYEKVFFLRDMGAKIQINASAVTGEGGGAAKKFANRLLKNGAVDFVGTDAHGGSHRPPKIAKCRDIIEKKYGAGYAFEVTRGNAEKILGSGMRF